MAHLEGALSGTSHDAGQLICRDPGDGRPLRARYNLAAASLALTRPESLEW